MSRPGFVTLFCISILILTEEINGKDISRLITGFIRSETDSKSATLKASKLPSVTRERLDEIRLYDRMKCFPRVLCTLTKADAFKHLGRVNLNDLADGYLTLLSAFPGGPKMKKPEPEMIYKQEDLNEEATIDQAPSDMELLASLLFPATNPDSEDQDEDETEDYYNRNKNRNSKPSTRDDEKEELFSDPEFQRKEKAEINKLMAELIEEEGVEAAKIEAGKPAASWSEAAMSLPLKIPMKIGGSLLKTFVIPYIMDLDRKKRELSSKSGISRAREGSQDISKTRIRIRPSNKQEDPLRSAMQFWRSLKDVKECATLFPTCPFQAWEVVSMIKLVGDQSKKNK